MEKLNIFSKKEDLFKAYSDLILRELKDKDQLAISLSGGSTPKALFDYWAENYRTTLPWHKIYFFWGDERCVPPTDEESNFGMTKKHLFDAIDIPVGNIFRILGENDPDEEAFRYSNILDDVLALANGYPVFDIMMLGLGGDGHTSSIFPHQIDLWENEKNCVVGIHPKSHQKRVSLTGHVINNSRIITFLVTGENKAEKVKDIVNPSEDAKKQFPAALVQPVSGELLWFLDDKAASQL